MRADPSCQPPAEKTTQTFREPGARSAAQPATERDYRRPAGPDRLPTPEEERLAEQQLLPAGTAEHY